MTKEQIFITEFIDYIKFEKNYSVHTIRAYQQDIEEFLLFSQKYNFHWEDLKPFAISLWLDHLNNSKLLSRTRIRKLSALKSLFDYLVKRKKISKNHFILFSSPKFKMNIPTILTPSVMIQMLQSMPINTILERRNKCIMILLYSTGMRSEELCTLTCDNIFLKRNSIKVIGKGNKERYIPLIPIAKESIEFWLDERSQLNKTNVNYLFLSRNGEMLTTSMIRKLVYCFSNLNKDIVEKRFHPHAFRYTFASHLLDNQSNLRHIQELLGHSSISATQRYTKISISNLQKKFVEFHPRAK